MPLAKSNVQLTVTAYSVLDSQVKQCKACQMHCLSICRVSPVIVCYCYFFLNLEQMILNNIRQIELRLNPKHTMSDFLFVCLLPSEFVSAHLLLSGKEGFPNTQIASNVRTSIPVFITGDQTCTKTTIDVFSGVSWFRLISVLLIRLVYVTGRVENRPKTLKWLALLILFHCYEFQHVGRFASFTLKFLCFLLCLLKGVHIVLGSCAAAFRKLTSLLFIRVRSCSCIPLTSASMTGSSASASLSLLFHIPLPSSLLLTSASSVISPILCATFLVLSPPQLHSQCLCLVPVFPLPLQPALSVCKMIAAVELLPTPGALMKAVLRWKLRGKRNKLYSMY